MITRTCKTKAKATLKLYNQLSSYLFEQSEEELRNVSKEDIEKIKDAGKVLAKIISSSK